MVKRSVSDLINERVFNKAVKKMKLLQDLRSLAKKASDLWQSDMITDKDYMDVRRRLYEAIAIVNYDLSWLINDLPKVNPLGVER